MIIRKQFFHQAVYNLDIWSKKDLPLVETGVSEHLSWTDRSPGDLTGFTHGCAGTCLVSLPSHVWWLGHSDWERVCRKDSVTADSRAARRKSYSCCNFPLKTKLIIFLLVYLCYLLLCIPEHLQKVGKVKHGISHILIENWGTTRIRLTNFG